MYGLNNDIVYKAHYWLAKILESEEMYELSYKHYDQTQQIIFTINKKHNLLSA